MLSKNSKYCIELMDGLEIVQIRLNEGEALELLRSFDNLFSPSLSSKLDIEAFACKLSQNANWILCKKDGETVAYLAFYRNQETHVDYITSYCEIPSNFDSIERIICYLINNTPPCIKEIRFRCRKDRTNDIRFYEGQGFEIFEDLEEDYLLRRLNLNNKSLL